MSEKPGIYPKLPSSPLFKTPPTTPPPQLENLSRVLGSSLQFTFSHTKSPGVNQRTFESQIHHETGSLILSSTLTHDQQVNFKDPSGRIVLNSTLKDASTFVVSSEDVVLGQVQAIFGQTKAKITAVDGMGVAMFRIDSSGRGYAEYEIIHEQNGTEIGRTKQSHQPRILSIVLTISPNFDTGSKGLILVMAHLLFKRFIEDSAVHVKSGCCCIL